MMDERELLSILKGQRANSITSSDDGFLSECLLDSYNQEPYGNEVEGRSQVVASDHFDTVESDMPSLVRVFLGSNKIHRFKEFSEADREEAEQKTLYADYLIRKQPDSFKIQHDWMKGAGLSRVSVVKFYPEERKRVRYVSYKDISLEELTIFMDDLQSEKGTESVEIESKEERGEESYNVNVKVITKEKKITIANVPASGFGITKGATSLQDAALVFDECEKRKGDLIAEGYDKKTVMNLVPTGMSKDEFKRRKESYESGKGEHWTTDKVLIRYEYALVDYDEDGIPERRAIVSCGEEILENIPYERVPYALLSQILMPDNIIGKSRGEMAADIQKKKTAVDRGIYDNIYAHSRPTQYVDDSAGSIDGGKVDFDDLLNDIIGKVVRIDGNPAESVMYQAEPYIGSEALQIIQYLDSKKSVSLGTIQGNQGLDSDKFYKETATRFEGVDESNKAKIELLCRVYAETGYRQLYEGVIWTAQHFQDEETEIMVLGKPLIVDPTKWRMEHYCDSQVGLGAGDSDESINNLAITLQTQMQLVASQSPLVDWKKIYNTLDDLTRAMGKADTAQYFNDPEVPEQQLMFMLQKLMIDNQAMMAQLQQANPLAEAEKLRAQAKLLEAQVKQQTEGAKLSENSRQFDENLAFEQSKFAADLAARLTDLEKKYGDNIPGALT